MNLRRLALDLQQTTLRTGRKPITIWRITPHLTLDLFRKLSHTVFILFVVLLQS